MIHLLLAILISLCLASPSLATVGFGTIGATSGGTTTLSLALPASLADGDLLVICIGNKYPTNAPSTPSGYTAPSNNKGTGDTGDGPANDLGATYATVFYKIAASESGNVAVTITSGNSSYGAIARYTNAGAGFTWDVAAANGGDSTSGTAWSATTGTDPGVTGGDMILACSARNNSSATNATSEAMSQSGATFGTAAERADNGTSFGDDVAIVVSDHVVTVGGTGNITYTFTNGVNTGGGTAILRMREVSTAPTATQSSQGFLGAIIK